MEWISVEDRLPEEPGYYRTKILVGSIAPKVQEMTKRFKIKPFPEFSKGDWVQVTHWKEGKITP